MATGVEAFRNVLSVSKSDANYLINFSARFRYIYVETPKVACSTIKRTLQYAEVDGDRERMPENVHLRYASPIPMLRDAYPVFQELLDDPEAIRFCFVRNPFSRALSCYLDKFSKARKNQRAQSCDLLGLPNDESLTFHDYLRAVKDQPDHQRNVHWMSQSYLLYPAGMRYDFIGRFEHLAADLEKLLEKLGIPLETLQTVAPHATSASQKIETHFGPREIDLVREIYEEDFATFGYGWSPRIL